MRNLFYLLLATSLLSTAPSFADDADDDCRDHAPAHPVCEVTFVKALLGCHSDLQNLKGNTRAQAEKACIKEALIARRGCVAQMGGGTDSCTADCKSANTTTINNCTTSFDPNSCNGDPSCQALMTQEQADCINQANTDLATCTSSCSTTL